MPHVFRLPACLAIAALFAGCSSGSGASGDVAVVNGTPISRATYQSKLESTQAAKQLLNQLIQGALIDDYAKTNHIVISDADIAKKEDEIKAKMQPGQFEAVLKSGNLTEDDVKKILAQQLVVQQAVNKNVHVSDADVASYFKANHAQYDTPEQVRARHILVRDQATAQMIEAKLKAGAKFEDLAKQYSTDPGSKDKGGELGFFGRGQMTPPFEQAAFSLPVGATSPPVKSQFGWHIIQVEEKKPAKMATLADVKEKIRQQLSAQQEQVAAPVFMNDLRRKAQIVIDDPQLKDALPPLDASGAGAAR